MNSKIEKNTCHSERYATTARQLRSCVSESVNKEMLKQVQHDKKKSELTRNGHSEQDNVIPNKIMSFRTR